MNTVVFAADHHHLPLPPGHRFPIEKYELVRLALVHEGLIPEESIRHPKPALPADLLAAHTPSYVEAVITGTIGAARMRRIGFPWSTGLVARSLASVGGSIAAADQALRAGVSGSLAGGTHHASGDEGEGFCVFNDQAVVALRLLERREVRRVAIVDLDVHQANGTAAIIGGREDVFLFSMHGERNYPFRKVPATLDVGLPDGTSDDEFNEILRSCLPTVEKFRPDIVLYQAGVDPLATDRLGRLQLTHRGLFERDREVLRFCRRLGIPVALALGGGYAVPIADTVRAHVGTYRAVAEVF